MIEFVHALRSLDHLNGFHLFFDHTIVWVVKTWARYLALPVRLMTWADRVLDTMLPEVFLKLIETGAKLGVGG